MELEEDKKKEVLSLKIVPEGHSPSVQSRTDGESSVNVRDSQTGFCLLD